MHVNDVRCNNSYLFLLVQKSRNLNLLRILGVPSSSTTVVFPKFVASGVTGVKWSCCGECSAALGVTLVKLSGFAECSAVPGSCDEEATAPGSYSYELARVSSSLLAPPTETQLALQLVFIS